MNMINHPGSFEIRQTICYKRCTGRRRPRGLGIYSIDPPDATRKLPCRACGRRPVAARTILPVFAVIITARIGSRQGWIDEHQGQ